MDGAGVAGRAASSAVTVAASDEASVGRGAAALLIAWRRSLITRSGRYSSR